jgi:hypothetical protein
MRPENRECGKSLICASGSRVLDSQRRLRRENEVHVLHADSARFDRTEAGALEQPHDLWEVDVPVSVTEMPPELRPPHRRSGKVNEQGSSAGLEDSTQFGGELAARSAAEVMEHHRAEDQVEARIRKREYLGRGILESNLDSRPRRFGTCSSNHFPRGIDATDNPGRPDSLFRENRESAGSAAHVEDVLTEP